MDGKNIGLTSYAYGMTMRVGRKKLYTLTLVAREFIIYVGTFGGTFFGSSSTIELSRIRASNHILFYFCSFNATQGVFSFSCGNNRFKALGLWFHTFSYDLLILQII
jgi:hypothetical protein